jgi:hypothetical protein
MQNDVDVKRQRERKEGKNKREGIKDAGLEITHERRSTIIIRAPEGYIPILQGGRQEIFHRIKPFMNIPEPEGLA